jgi:hypothetical protein
VVIPCPTDTTTGGTSGWRRRMLSQVFSTE